MKAYIGQRLEPTTAGECLVEVTDTGEDADRRPLPVRLDLRNHSTTGFSWGYGGSGPAQLALAMLAEHLGDDHAALGLYQKFKGRRIATLEADHGWKITAAEIDDYLAEVGYVRPTVRKLLASDEYESGDLAIEYVEEGRGLCRAFVDNFDRRMVRIVPVGLENREPIEAARDQPGKLVRHDGAGGDALSDATAADRPDRRHEDDRDD